jgi:preprotein translocase subunit SecG
MIKVLLVIHLLIAIAMVAVILLQRSEGGVLGIGGGGGLMTGRAAGNLLTRATAVLVTLFFLTSLGLALMSNSRAQAPSLMDQVPAKSGLPLLPGMPSAPAATTNGGNVTPQSAPNGSSSGGAPVAPLSQ